ncbi:MAG: GNAT family N-acetyltransferase [Chloroflexota bacterium]
MTDQILFPQEYFSTTKGKVIIRLATPADAIQFSELRMQALRDNPTAFGSSYETRENCSLEWATKVLQPKSKDGAIYIAEHGQQLLGITSILRAPGIKTRHSATIGGVFILPEWRRLGIIDAFVMECIKWAKLQDVIIIKLAVTTNNQPAIKTYTRLGFEIYGTEPKVIFHDSTYYDEYLMSINIENNYE